MNVLSLFDGMSCGRIALERAGVKVDKYFASEIKKHAIKVTQENYPDTIQLGDVCDIKAENLPQIDLLIGGSPCQNFSQANKERKGLEGEKSVLFFEYLRLLEECNPKYFLLENVKMKKEHEDEISRYMGCKPVRINSKLVSPQLRDRLYWTNIPNVCIPDDKGILLNDILEYGYSDREKSRALMESDSRPNACPVKSCHRYFNTGFTTLIFKSEQHYEEIRKVFDANFKGKSAKEIDVLMGRGQIDLSVFEGVRYMNKRERAMCQTVPKNYVDILSEKEAACLFGDGWTVDVIAHLLKGLA